MTITYNQVSNILKKLPITYYTKDRNSKVILDKDGNNSYCEFFTGDGCEIHISYNMIERIAKSLPETDNDELLENDIRCLFYHEVSHAYLTPRKLSDYVNRFSAIRRVNKELLKEIVNIFEDERIESLLRDYYMRVNFREFCKRLNNYDETSEPDNSISKFYELVRFRKGSKELVEQVHTIIMTYSNFKYSTDSYSRIIQYISAIVDLYLRISDGEKDSSSSLKEIKFNNSSPKGIKFNSSSIENNKNSDYDSELVLTESESNELFRNSVSSISSPLSNELNDPEIIGELRKIISQINNTNKNNGSAINSYSGRFDPRSVARDDYKYFLQQNRVGHSKMFSKINFNLFIDVSGSFSSNEYVVNKILYSLVKYEEESPDFNFNLVTMSMGERLKDKKERQIKCSGGNCFSSEIFDIYKEIQLPNYENYNIVLFDGDAFTDGGTISNFKVFNHKNTTIISNRANESYINKYCKEAKIIISNNYVEDLYENIIRTLKNFAR